jgi:hypothetical protein
MNGTDTEDTEESGIKEISCPVCQSDVFKLRAGEDFDSGETAYVVFCADCGTSAGKIDTSRSGADR